MIEFREITVDNWHQCIRLELMDEEKTFIHPNVYSIAEAQFYPKAISRAVYNKDTVVGYTMYGEDEDKPEVYYIDRLMISKDHRKKGYASACLKLIIDEASAKAYKRLSTSIDQDNVKMKELLVKNGFYTKNELDGEEIYYHFDIQQA